MGLTREFRERVQARYRSDERFRRVVLGGAVESLLAGEGAREGLSDSVRPASSGSELAYSGQGYWRAAVGREILRDFINATLGFPALAQKTGIHVKTLHQMFGPKGNPTAANLFNIIACLQEQEGVRLQVVA